MKQRSISNIIVSLLEILLRQSANQDDRKEKCGPSGISRRPSRWSGAGWEPSIIINYIHKDSWALRDSNPGPTDYESAALTAELRALNRASNL